MKQLILKCGLLCVVLLGIACASFAQSFSVQCVGNGKQSIILIPGFACSGEVWRQTVDTLKRDYTCYVLTMPGFAEAAPEKDPSFDGWTKQIADFIRKEKIEKPILMGHSMGGGLALNVASTNIDLVKGIVVVDALPCLAALYNPNFQTKKITNDELEQAGSRLLGMSNEEFSRQAYISAASLTTDSLRYNDLVKWSLLSDRKTYAKMYYDYSNVDLRAAIRHIPTQALVLLEHPFKKIAPVIKQQFGEQPNFRIEYAEKGLHFIMFDDWEWYIGHLFDFLHRQS